jgi:pyruvate dehydrogenase E2 component (dihydrolipoamide acetyltransferase)
MAVVKEFALPDLGEGLTEAEIVRWMVEVGDVVAVDQPVVEVETAKAMVEVPCPYAGVITERFGSVGDEVPVGRPLVTVTLAVGEDQPAAAEGPADLAAGSAGQGTVSKSGGDSGERSGSGNVLVGYGTSGAAPRRRRVLPGVNGSERGALDMAPVVPGPAAPAAPSGPVPVVSPLVRRLAREHGLDLRSLRGSGTNGLILRSDVERAIAGQRDGAVAASAEATRVQLRGVRGAVAEKLSRSRREIPDATTWVDADATELLAVRAAMNAGTATADAVGKVSVLALLARICVAGLARYPELNAFVDTAANEIVKLPAVHIGFAAQTERGLVVPVVRDAHTRTTEGLSERIAALTESARAGTLSPGDLTGGTFTLNNYGVFGVDGSTPIINHPEAAMLGVGRIAQKPWVVEGELAVRHVVQLSLTFDHRVCDGGTAGGFLRFVADCVERPALLLRSV